MSLIKRWREQVIERMVKAFPELSEENISVNMTMANDFEEFFTMCMNDAAIFDAVGNISFTVNYTPRR